MTRLTSGDINTLSDQLISYDEKLRMQTGEDLLGIACHNVGVSKKIIAGRIKHLTAAAVTMTPGLGEITGFAGTIRDILFHLGFNAFVPDKPDVAGIAQAVKKKSDLIFMADDSCFIALNLKNHLVIDNGAATGSTFAAALDLMAGGLKDQRVLVLGCGPVGMAAAETLLRFGARVSINDRDMEKCEKQCLKLEKDHPNRVEPAKSPEQNSEDFHFFVEATTAEGVITASMIGPETRIAAPGVPFGVTPEGLKTAEALILHDPLQLGTAGMAVSAILSD